jgi:hypothetical protein
MTAIRSRLALTVLALATVAGTASASTLTTTVRTAETDPVHSDFNGDGYEDLAIGVPSETVNGYLQAGAVHVLYGGPNGLTATGDQFFAQSSPGVSGAPERRDFFGHALAAGDFSADGYADLAIGVPGEDIGDNTDEGIVEVLHGSRDGLSARSSLAYGSGTGATLRCRCRFGAALAAGDVDADGAADLVIGVPLLDSLDGPDQGGAVLLYGRRGSGIEGLGRRLLREVHRHFDDHRWGSALATGDHDGDGLDDIAIGTDIPVGADWNGGRVGIITGSAGRRPTPWRLLRQIHYDELTGLPSDGVAGTHDEEGDGFGRSLAFGDFDGDGRAEIAVGIPHEDHSGKTDAGAIVVWNSLPSSVLARPRSQVLTQADLDGASPQSGDRFGLTLTAGDFDGDGRDDLAIGVPFEDFSGSSDAGIVHVLRGSPVGLRTTDALIFHQNKPGIAGSAESGDAFGLSLTTGRYSDGSHADLAIGIPGEALGSTKAAGAVSVLYGGPSFLTSTGSQLWSQDSSGIADTASTNDKFGTSFG